MSMPQQDFERVCTSLKDMMVAMLIKNNQFDEAKEVVKKYFSKSMVGKKAIFMDLIKRKSNLHEVIEQIDFQRFKEEMLVFCQCLCPFSVPFLHKAATQLFDKRREKQDINTAEPDEQDEAVPSSSHEITIEFVPCKLTTIQRTRLRMAYKALATGPGERTFAQLEEEVKEAEQARKEDLSRGLSPAPRKGSIDLEQDGLFQRDSESPMEASPADQPPQTNAVPETESGWLSKTPSVLCNKHLNTVARLVIEPDSQGSSQCTAASQEQETDVRTEEPPQSLAVSNKKDLQSLGDDYEVFPTQANKTCSRASTSFAESLTDSEEDHHGSVANRDIPLGKHQNQSNSFLSNNSTRSEQPASDSEEDPLESLGPCKTPVRKPRKQRASKLPEDVCITDSCMDSSPELFPLRPFPKTSSTPNKDSAQNQGPSHLKWKQMFNTAKESKDTWSDEESHFNSRKNNGLDNESTISNSANRKRKWSESETKKLQEGVKIFGEGNWSKIKAHYSFNDRTNVNLKDRWRTMKKLNMI
ncbi:telomeric repeat binding factor a isoform X1 [Clinocottus analis]